MDGWHMLFSTQWDKRVQACQPLFEYVPIASFLCHWIGLNLPTSTSDGKTGWQNSGWNLSP